MIWLPFGKLAHTFLVFMSRGQTGAMVLSAGGREHDHRRRRHRSIVESKRLSYTRNADVRSRQTRRHAGRGTCTEGDDTLCQELWQYADGLLPRRLACTAACAHTRATTTSRTEDPKYTPIWKIEPFKQAYKREAGPLALLLSHVWPEEKGHRRSNSKNGNTLLYDSCTVCGRCSLVCPMGIDIASLVSMARHGMFKAGLIPHELHAVARARTY